MDKRIGIYRIGMVTSVGVNAKQSAASVRAGLSRFEESSIHNKHFQPMVMAILPEDVLPPLVEDLEKMVGMTSREIRMLKLASMALGEAAIGLDGIEKIPVFLGVPEAWPGRKQPASDHFLARLALQSGMGFKHNESRLFPEGRAAGLVALHAAVEAIVSGKHQQVLVGGVDTYVDLYLLGTLDMENRVLTEGIMDGFVPGEGAGFLLLSEKDLAQGREAPLALLGNIGVAFEEGHRYSGAVYRGDGLAAAVSLALNGSEGKIQIVFAGLNGENFGAKEWGVAYLRNSEHFEEDLKIEHPADCIGDTGAAMGPLMVEMALRGMERGYIEAPCLIWCSSDFGQRAAVVIYKN